MVLASTPRGKSGMLPLLVLRNERSWLGFERGFLKYWFSGFEGFGSWEGMYGWVVKLLLRIVWVRRLFFMGCDTSWSWKFGWGFG